MPLVDSATSRHEQGAAPRVRDHDVFRIIEEARKIDFTETRSYGAQHLWPVGDLVQIGGFVAHAADRRPSSIPVRAEVVQAVPVAGFSAHSWIIWVALSGKNDVLPS